MIVVCIRVQVLATAGHRTIQHRYLACTFKPEPYAPVVMAAPFGLKLFVLAAWTLGCSILGYEWLGLTGAGIALISSAFGVAIIDWKRRRDAQ